jgi:UDP-N-acetyl-D-galactosamine dehydrogenase
MIKKNILVMGSKAFILGITFKENCSDVRNTKALDIFLEILDYGINVEFYDP